MKNFFSAILIVFAATAVFNGCDDSVSGGSIPGPARFLSEQSPYYLNGTVTDGKGFPIAGAEIHYMFTLWMPVRSGFRIPMKTMPSTNITFDMPLEGQVSLKIYRLGTRELVSTLIDKVLLAGRYSVTFNAATLTNGFYIYQLITKDTFSEKLMLLNIDDVSALVKTTPLTRTDAEGKFRLPQSVFGLDEKISVTTEKGPEVVAAAFIDSIAIVVYQSGKLPLIQWMSINKNSTMEHTYILQ
ncbi:MAG: hypothetical protein ACOYNS_10905 [Bacteroidota bacterium]